MRAHKTVCLASMLVWAVAMLLTWDHVPQDYGQAANLYTVHSSTNAAAPWPWPGLVRTTNNSVPITNGGPARFYHVRWKPVFLP